LFTLNHFDLLETLLFYNIHCPSQQCKLRVNIHLIQINALISSMKICNKILFLFLSIRNLNYFQQYIFTYLNYASSIFSLFSVYLKITKFIYCLKKKIKIAALYVYYLRDEIFLAPSLLLLFFSNRESMYN
jgi:hypothetical protein